VVVVGLKSASARYTPSEFEGEGEEGACQRNSEGVYKLTTLMPDECFMV
jgi:hypothetical protein